MKKFALFALFMIASAAIADARPKAKDEPPPDCFPKECLAS